jgi:RecA-family ATPase
MWEYFTSLFPDLADNEQINIRADFPEGLTAKGFINYFLDTVDEAVVACLHLRKLKAHAYVSINPRDREMVEAEKGKEGSPGGKCTVSRVTILFSDYDYPKMGQSRDQALEYLRSLPCPPSMIIDSGNGLQVYWLLLVPATSTEDKARAEKIMAGMCEWWQTDKVKDYSRVLRVGGTLNVKYDPPRECFIAQPDNGARYSLDELEAMIPEEYRSPQFSSSSRSHSGKGAGEEHRNGGDPLATPEVPLGPNSNRHPRGTSVVGHYASHRTSSGRPVSEEWVKRQAELWFENPNNCSAPLHLSEDPKETREWNRLVSDIYEKEQENIKMKASENGHGSPGAAAAAVMQHVGARSVEDLLKREFPPIKWAIPDIVPEGVTLLSAREKTGKSWLVLGWLLAVATGGKALGCKQVEQGAVLYLALEDSERRLKERIKGVLKGRTPDLSGFEYATQWEKADEGGAERLDAWLTDHPHTRLVVIDVLKMWRAKTNTRDGIYNVDYESVAELIALSKKHNVSIVIVHHNNKQVKPEDPFDNISGSTGLLGAVDAIIVMQRERGKDVASYWITGKDIEATSRHAMTWKPKTLSWVLEGDAEKYFETEERLEIEELLEADKELWTPKDIATALDKNPATVRWLLSKITQSETSRVAKHSYGKYCHTSSPHYKGDELLASPTHPPNSSEEDRESLSEELDDPTNSTNSTNSPLDKPDTGGGTTNSHSASTNTSPPATNSSEKDPGGESPRVGGVGGVGSAEEKKPLSSLTNIVGDVEISEEELEQEMHEQRVWERKNKHRKKRGGSR